MKLLIVDDEQRIVMYLEHILDWKVLGFNEIKGVSNATVAEEILLSCEPDLMITDIRMPNISGLDLAKLVVKNRLKTKVIVLSGYNDFNYAQKAIRLGVADYLLKPITGRDLLPVVKRIISTIPKGTLKNKIEKKDILKFFIEGLSTVTEKSKFFFEDESYYIYWEESFLPGAVQLKLGNQYLTITDKKIYTLSDVTQTLSKKNLQQIFCDFFQISIDDYQFPILLLNQINTGNWDDVLNTIEFNSKGLQNQYLFQVDLLQIFSKKFPDILSNIDINEIFDNSGVSSFFSEYMKEFIVNEERQSSGNQLAVNKIIEYIHLNYGEEITLETLKDLVFMHPVTISKIFKATTGSTLTTFLTKVRIEAAADLLEHSNLLVSDIANLVGYHKTQYFIKLFKQKYGITPQKYRRKIRLEGEHDV